MGDASTLVSPLRLSYWWTTGKIPREYFTYSLAERGYELETFGEKTHAVFDELLLHFSIGQVFNLTWQAVRDTDYIVKERLPKYHAKNTFIGAVQRKADKARAEGWTVRNSRRDFNCPPTVVSSVFFDVFAQLGGSAIENGRASFSRFHGIKASGCAMRTTRRGGGYFSQNMPSVQSVLR